MATDGGGGYPLESVVGRCWGTWIVRQDQERTPQSLVSSLPLFIRVVNSCSQSFPYTFDIVFHRIWVIRGPCRSRPREDQGSCILDCTSASLRVSDRRDGIIGLWGRVYGELVGHIPPPYGGYCAVCCCGHTAVRSHARQACYVASV
jgi:hypothetical protein